jgi:hypothetical protein
VVATGAEPQMHTDITGEADEMVTESLLRLVTMCAYPVERAESLAGWS